MLNAGDILVRRFGEEVQVLQVLTNCGGGIIRHERTRGGETEKTESNLSRARSRVFELARCNPWEYFVTLTLDGEKRDREDLRGYIRDLGQYLRNLRRLRGCEVKYLLIPERHHQSPGWHMHGLIMGLPPDELQPNEYGYLDWPGYRARFGFVSMGLIRDLQACSRYITKYISKDLAERRDELGAHLFYASHGLQGADRIGVYRHKFRDAVPFEYMGEMVRVSWFSLSEWEDLAHGLREVSSS